MHVPSHKSGLRSRLPRAVYAPLSAHTLRRQYCIGLNEYVDKTKTLPNALRPAPLARAVSYGVEPDDRQRGEFIPYSEC